MNIIYPSGKTINLADILQQSVALRETQRFAKRLVYPAIAGGLFGQCIAECFNDIRADRPVWAEACFLAALYWAYAWHRHCYQPGYRQSLGLAELEQSLDKRLPNRPRRVLGRLLGGHKRRMTAVVLATAVGLGTVGAVYRTLKMYNNVPQPTTQSLEK